MTATPVVALHMGGASTGVSYRPARLGAALAGRPIRQALTLLPRLLPVCATAQAIAATRALEAAQGSEATAADASQREQSLWREQLIAGAWRILIDWPRWLGETADLAVFKELRAEQTSELARALLQRLPDWPAGESLEAVLERLRDGTDPVSRLLTAGIRCRLSVVPEPHLLAGNELAQRVQERLVSGVSATTAAGMTQSRTDCSSASVVGPLAMQRHARIAEIAARNDLSPVGRLLLAQWLDMRALAQMPAATPAVGTDQATASAPGTGSGIGLAPTARGPLYHYLAIDDDDRVLQWRYLAPTDWHCGEGGVLAALARGTGNPDALRLALAAVDPCAPWQLQDRDDA